MQYEPQEGLGRLERFPRKNFESVCFHALGLLSQNQEYLDQHLQMTGADEQSLGALADMRAAAAQLERALGEMMALLECAAAAPQPHLRGVDLGLLLRAVAAEAQLVQNCLGVSLILDCPEGPCIALADWAEAETICMQLLSNALRACSRGGKIWLQLQSTEAGGWQLRVADDGCGLPDGKNDLENRRRFLGGAGAGLLLCREYCAHMSWSMELRRRAPSGTEAVITIPAVEVRPGPGGIVELWAPDPRQLDMQRYRVRQRLALELLPLLQRDKKIF